MPSVLIVDDEPNIRRMVAALLRAEGFDVREASSGADGVTSIMDDEPDAALLDLMMPGELDGMATLAKIRQRWSDLPVVMMSGRASLGDAVRATKLGAVNFLEKPLAPETVLLALSSALELRQSRRTTRELREALGLTGDMVGSSVQMERVRGVIARVAPSDSRVLISGESGTGKELVAAAIHDRSPRKDRPFVRVNCAAIPRDLVESEMFGHEKGSFTGATATRVGRFEMAHTGTLFLDEVGDLNVEAQAKLLRAIEAKEIQRVGGNRTIRVDVRVIAATNKDLTKAVVDGTFREDLYFRLNVIPIMLPPLRERGEDVVQLVQHFSTLQHERIGRPTLHWSDEALVLVRGYAWPGNVRELANIVERIAILNDGSLVRASDMYAVLPRAGSNVFETPTRDEAGLVDALDHAERTLITDALARTDGNIAEAARQLKTDRPNLYRRMKRLGITGAVLGIMMLASPPGRMLAQGTAADTTAHGAVSTTDTTADSTISLLDHTAAFRAGFSLSSGKTYNRVEGLPILLGPTFALEHSSFALDAAAYGIVRTGRDWDVHEPNAGHDAHVDLRFGMDRRFGLQGRVYNIVAPTQSWQMTEPEQGLAAFLLRRDFQDYYGRRGAQVSGSWLINQKTTVTAAYADERWTSRNARDVFSVFRGDSRWRDNPQMDDGHVRLYTLDATFDTRNDEREPSVGWYLTGNYEIGTSPMLTRPLYVVPPALGGLALGSTTDLRYERVFFDVRRYNRISPRTQINGRVVFGGWVGGDPLPLERKLSVGGPGTMPGYDFNRPVGAEDVQMCTSPGQNPHGVPAQCDRVLLSQLEFRTELASAPFKAVNSPRLRIRSAGFTARPVGVLFLDVGRGWRTTMPWPSRYKTDAGAGIDLGLLGLYATKALSDRHEPVNLFVRVRRRF